MPSNERKNRSKIVDTFPPLISWGHGFGCVTHFVGNKTLWFCSFVKWLKTTSCHLSESNLMPLTHETELSRCFLWMYVFPQTFAWLSLKTRKQKTEIINHWKVHTSYTSILLLSFRCGAAGSLNFLFIFFFFSFNFQINIAEAQTNNAS